MKVADQTLQKKIGRPLSFDRELALQQAMLVFWQHGYEATSIRNLTSAMGITSPSVYAAFGDKKQLFFECIDYYLNGEVNSKSIIDSANSSKNAAWGLLSAASIGYTSPNFPKGCLLASSAISCSHDAADVAQSLSLVRHSIELQLKNKIIQDLENGTLEKNTDADALAGFVMSVIQGMSTLARDGAARDKLIRMSKLAVQHWPEVCAAKKM